MSEPLSKITTIHFIPAFCPQCGGALVKEYVPEEKTSRLVCEKCRRITYLNPQIVAGALVTKDDKLILLRRGIEPAKSQWTYPAGFVELGESVEQGAARETAEEVGLEVRPTQLFGVYSYPHHGVVTVVYLAEITGGQAHTSPEAEEIGEFSPEQIPWKELAFESTRDAIKDWVQFVKKEKTRPSL